MPAVASIDLKGMSRLCKAIVANTCSPRVIVLLLRDDKQLRKFRDRNHATFLGRGLPLSVSVPTWPSRARPS